MPQIIPIYLGFHFKWPEIRLLCWMQQPWRVSLSNLQDLLRGCQETWWNWRMESHEAGGIRFRGVHFGMIWGGIPFQEPALPTPGRIRLVKGPGETVAFGLGEVGSRETDERKPSDKPTQSSSYMQPITPTVPVLSFRMEDVWRAEYKTYCAAVWDDQSGEGCKLHKRPARWNVCRCLSELAICRYGWFQK